MNPFIEFIHTAITDEEAQEIQRLLELIDSFQNKIENQGSSSIENLQNLAQARLNSSNSLKRGEIATWQRANSFLEECLALKQNLNWSLIVNVNSILNQRKTQMLNLGMSNSQFDRTHVRDQEIYIGRWQACPQKYLIESIDYFRLHILNMQYGHPLIKLATIQYWLISLHPFLDGNGRTSVLIADYLSLQNGYLPQSFSSMLDAIIMAQPERGTSCYLGRAQIKILNNILRSYQILLG